MPVTLRRHLKSPPRRRKGLVPVQSRLQDGPLLCYDYRLPAGMASLPTDNPRLRYGFELRRLGRLGQPQSSSGGGGSPGQPPHPAGRLPFSARGPGLQ